ncbi:nucleotidyltransferase domain-containing protein [Cyclobacterium roseum]|uniref:nucleotidyltransferase domain-containing protein n=1 Tax=Cyclobacterium roseum TaxID=2666137 RepID=UPI001390F607|nr:nucleotidyltransferase domain-containing protein [Cyclobacterium roseum]
MAKREIVELLKKYVFLLRSEGIAVDRAYLFGSYLSNTANEDSDIDIMIVTETEDDYLSGKIWNLTKKVNSKIEPYHIAKARFYDKVDSPLIELIKRTGLQIA